MSVQLSSFWTISLVPPLTVFIVFDTGDRGTPGLPGTKGDHGERGLRGPAGVSQKNIMFIMHRLNNNTVPITVLNLYVVKMTVNLFFPQKIC